MSQENFLWGAPRIHGELLKLGFDVSQATVSRYMPRRSYPPTQSWRTFLRNQAFAIGTIGLGEAGRLSDELLACMGLSMSRTDFEQRHLSSFLSYPFVRPLAEHPFVPTRGLMTCRAQGRSRMAVAKSFIYAQHVQATP